MSLVNTNWLGENLSKVKIIDCSWHMPQTKRSGLEEYKKVHIPNSIFFDLDKNSKQNTDLPHMLTDLNSWKNIVSNMGIKNDDQICEIGTGWGGFIDTILKQNKETASVLSPISYGSRKMRIMDQQYADNIKYDGELAAASADALAQAQGRAEAMEGASCEIKVPVTEEGALYGSVGTREIADAFIASEINVDKSDQ